MCHFVENPGHSSLCLTVWGCSGPLQEPGVCVCLCVCVVVIAIVCGERGGGWRPEAAASACVGLLQIRVHNPGAAAGSPAAVAGSRAAAAAGTRRWLRISRRRRLGARAPGAGPRAAAGSPAVDCPAAADSSAPVAPAPPAALRPRAAGWARVAGWWRWPSPQPRRRSRRTPMTAAAIASKTGSLEEHAAVEADHLLGGRAAGDAGFASSVRGRCRTGWDRESTGSACRRRAMVRVTSKKTPPLTPATKPLQLSVP